MKRIRLIVALTALCVSPALAQQDPDDPGIQDSVIIIPEPFDFDREPYFQYGLVHVIAVTDDSVMFYNLPLKWHAPRGGAYFGTGTQYFMPLTSWDVHFDTVITSESYVRQIGWADLNIDTLWHPPLKTDGWRLYAWTLRFVIGPEAPSQLIVLDTCLDNRNGSAIFGLIDGTTEITPGFQRGFISILPYDVEEVNAVPKEASLGKNHPNPFNPSTEIEFAISTSGPVTIEIFNLMGQRVTVLADQVYESGIYSVYWQGRDERGNLAPSGVYFYKMNAPGFSDVKKMTLLK
jgi:hypothetical protein